MSGALRALLEGVIDYAGMFPPAQLPLEQALALYQRYRAELDAWMLSRFVLAAARLTDIPKTIDPGFRVAALGRGGQDVPTFFENVRRDLAEIIHFQKETGARAETFEVRLPATVCAPPRKNQLAAVVGTVAYLIESNGLKLRPFFELPALERPLLETWVETLMQDRVTLDAARRQFCAAPGWKLRLGGDTVPEPAQVAWVLGACCAAKIPWKATAGLHHPLCRRAPGGFQHGFVNVFAAAVLAHANQLDLTQVEALLADEDPSHFRMNDTELAWQETAAPVETIRAARSSWVTTFGSCSFDEPRDDLRVLGWGDS